MEIPQDQNQIDWKKPEDHLAFFLRNMPSFAGIGMVTHFGFLQTWAKHLWKCGVVHRDYLVRLADEDGNINVSQLPKQTIKFQKAMRGPHHQYNAAARWVSEDTKDPEPIRLPDIKDLTLQEQQVMVHQFRQAGLLPDTTPQPLVAEVINEPGDANA